MKSTTSVRVRYAPPRRLSRREFRQIMNWLQGSASHKDTRERLHAGNNLQQVAGRVLSRAVRLGWLREVE